MKTKWVFLLGLLGLMNVGTGCRSPGTVYDRRQINQLQRADWGTIEQSREITIEGRSGPIGTLGGAGMGAAATSTVGHGAGRGMAQAGGAIVGAVAGQAVEKTVTRRPGLELTITLDNGNTVVVAQETPPNFGVGDRVRVLSGAGIARVAMP